MIKVRFHDQFMGGEYLLSSGNRAYKRYRQLLSSHRYRSIQNSARSAVTLEFLQTSISRPVKEWNRSDVCHIFELRFDSSYSSKYRTDYFECTIRFEFEFIIFEWKLDWGGILKLKYAGRARNEWEKKRAVDEEYLKYRWQLEFPWLLETHIL